MTDRGHHQDFEELMSNQVKRDVVKRRSHPHKRELDDIKSGESSSESVSSSTSSDESSEK